jgi:hypothetical protein
VTARSKYGMGRITGLIVFAGVAFGCSCADDAPACERFPKAPVVFTGKVVWGNDDGSGKFTQATLYRVRVEEAFRGLGAEEREVLIDPGSYTSCYREYSVGESYLFYAGAKANVAATTVMRGSGPAKVLPAGIEKLNVYGSAICSGSKLLAKAGGDVAWIRSSLRGESKTRVYGAAYQHRLFQEADPGDVPLEGAKVVLTDGLQSVSVETGPDGGFSFEGVAQGRYRLSATRAPWTPSMSESINVASGACVERVLKLGAKAAVSGVVRGAGTDVVVELVRVLRDGGLAKLASIWTYTDAEGKFRMEDLPAGRFVVGVNVASPMTADRPYGMSRYPAVLKLEPNGVVSGLEFDLQEARPVRTVRVRVFWGDGREVASGARAWAAPVERADRFLLSKDAKGGNVVTLRLMEEYSYRVGADWFSMAGGRMDHVRSGEVILPAGKGDSVVDIRLEGVR